MALLSIACGKASTGSHLADTFTAKDGTPFSITFIAHASIVVTIGDTYLYIDPVSSMADYSAMPKADVILVTHSHYDHLDARAIDTLWGDATKLICDKTSAASVGRSSTIMAPTSSLDLAVNIHIDAVAAYNTTDGHLQFHPRERQDCGYIITIGGSRIYVAGDSEPTPEMLALRDIDIAFLPVNQPYTMTVDQAVEAVKAIRPTIFYPYHYGQTDIRTDIKALTAQLKGITDVRIRNLE